jgi:hypothetical protein
LISKVWQIEIQFLKSKLVKYSVFKKIQKFPNFFRPSGKIHHQKNQPQSLAMPKHIGTHNPTYKRILCKTLEAQQLQ